MMQVGVGANICIVYSLDHVTITRHVLALDRYTHVYIYINLSLPC